MKMTLETILFTAVLATAASSVFAGTAYELKENSDSTTLEVNANIPKMVAITKPADMPLMTFTGKGPMEATSNFCIASNIEGGMVGLSVSTTDSSGKYQLTQKKSISSAATVKSKGIDGRQLGFSVFYQNEGGSEEEMTNGQSKKVAGAKWISQCNAEKLKGSSIKVKIEQEDAEKVYAGDYTTTLTLTVSAQ